MGLDRDNPVPLYIQLKDVLASQVADGTLQVGARFPSEREIHEEFCISRTTVREALRLMEREGLIETVPGRGTFVAHRSDDLTVRVTLSGFSADLSREKFAPSSVVLDARLISSPDACLIKALGLRPHTEVVYIQRLRLVNNRPLALHDAYLPHALCPRLLHHNLAQASLFELLHSEYGLRLARAEETVCAALANEQEVKLLALEPPASVLRAERTTYLDTGDVVEFARASYCGEWYRLRVELDPGR